MSKPENSFTLYIAAATAALTFFSGALARAEPASAAAAQQTTATAPEKAVPAPNIDTNGDGTPDAWDKDGNGKADAWDTDGDGKPDAWDKNGDGKPDEKKHKGH